MTYLQEILPKKRDLIINSGFKVAPTVDIEVANGIVYYFCQSSQSFSGLLNDSQRKCDVIITCLDQDMTTNFVYLTERPIFIHPYTDAGTGLVHKIIGS